MPSRAQYESYLDLPQVKAVLDTIAWAEGADYNIKFGGGTFSGNQHPNDCIPYRNTCSTAAGRYQFLHSTWRSLGLPDFSPRNQDIGALMLIQRRGALDEILNGDFEGALRSGALGREWASLPFSPYGQPVRSLAATVSYYNSALAVYGGQQPTNVNYSPGTGDNGGSNLGTAAIATSTVMMLGLGFLLFIVLLDD